MAEWKLFEGLIPFVSTAEFHKDRGRAAHLEQGHHQDRLHAAAKFVREAGLEEHSATFSDLGCGDGGLLSLVQNEFVRAWGYDFQPSNEAGWAERGVKATLMDVFGKDRPRAILGNVVAATEVLEHVADPRDVLTWIYETPQVYHLICSSPVNEHAGSHDECHAWAWDSAGYRALVESVGWNIEEHEIVYPFQVIKAAK